MNTVALITNKENIKTKLQNSPILLRKTDRFVSVNFENAKDVLNEMRPSVILIHDEIGQQEAEEIIKFVRANKVLSLSHIILLIGDYDSDFMLQTYDLGADTFLRVSSEPAEMLVAVINGMKKYQLNKKLARYSANLEYLGVLDKKNKFYTSKAAEDMINLELYRNNYNAGSFVIFSLDESSKKTYDYEKMISVIKNNLRLNDIVISYSSLKFGFLTESEKASAIIERIASELPKDWIIRAGATFVNGTKYEELEKNSTCALNNAILNNELYSVYSEKSAGQEEWLNEELQDDKVYKFYKKAFRKKVENIISPVFYRTQKAYEDKIGDAKIEQFTDEKQSVFRIICGKKESRLTMLYPGYSKLVVHISHSGLDSPENREITISIKEISSSKISEILEGFVNEYIGVYRHDRY